MVSFIFGGNTNETPETLAQKRRIAQALAANNGTPRNIGEGLSAIGNALVYRSMMGKADASEKAGRAGATKAFDALFSAPGAAAEVASTSPAPSTATVDLTGDRKTFIDSLLPAAIEESKRTGVDPRIIVAQAAQETGWGKSAPGNNFFGIKSHGKGGGQNLATHEYVDGKRVNVTDSFRTFASPGDSVRGYGDFILENPRYGKFRSAQGLDNQLAELQASGYATDPNYSNSVGSIARSIQMPNAPAEVASLDPSIGMPDAAGQVAATSPASPPTPQPVQAPQPQVAQALSAPQQAQQAPSGPSQQAIIKALSDPWLSDEQRGVAQALLKRQMDQENAVLQQQLEQQDPAYKIGLEKSRLELENLRNPTRDPLKVGQGETVIGPDGKVIFKSDPKPEAKPSAVQEYEYAKEQGFPGTFQDWEASKKGGMSLQVDPATGAVTFQQGGNIKPMTEGQSKDAVFSTRAEGALDILDEHAGSLIGTEGAVGNTLGQLPIVGNYVKSEGYQQAEQAGKEFLQAILRKDTGAAITKDETSEYGSVYLPSPGDKPETLLQKAASRRRALEAIKAGMPPQAILAQEKALAATAEKTKQAPKAMSDMTDEELEAIINGQ